MNNYEKIKAMSIEEMARFLIEDVCLSCVHLCKRNCAHFSCVNGIKQWLKEF